MFVVMVVACCGAFQTLLFSEDGSRRPRVARRFEEKHHFLKIKMCRSLYRCPDFVRESYHNIVWHIAQLCNPMSIVVATALYGFMAYS